MGDNLTFAREFVDSAANELSRFFARSERPNFDELSGAITQIQSGAKQLHARGIYQSAQSVLQCLDAAPFVPAIVDGRLLALNKLIAQYADGLSELDAAVEIESTKNINPSARINDAPESVERFTEPQEALGQNYKAAKNTVTSLYRFTRREEKIAIKNLIQAAERKTPKEEPRFLLDTEMRDVVQDALGIARMSGKTISISYDVGETALPLRHLNTLKTRLSQSLRAIILESLPLESVGHVDLVVKGENLCLKSQGPAPKFVSHKSRVELGQGAEFQLYLPLTIQQDEANKETSDIATAPRVQPLITEETESELRSKLSALMDRPEPALLTETIAEVGR